MKLSFLIVLSFINIAVFAQVQLDQKNAIYTNNFDMIGKELRFMNTDSAALAPNNYVYKRTKRDRDILIYFTINSAGKTEGPIVAKSDDQVLMRCTVKNGILQRYEKINPKLGKPSDEGFARGDTVISRSFDEKGMLEAEYRKLNDKTIFTYRCSYDDETGKVSSSNISDEIKGLYEGYEKGVLQKRLRVKGLPVGMASKTEYFELGKLSSAEIEYKNGNSKVTNKDGSYLTKTQSNGKSVVREYDKKGKLTSTYDEVFISVPSN